MGKPALSATDRIILWPKPFSKFGSFQNVVNVVTTIADIHCVLFMGQRLSWFFTSVIPFHPRCKISRQLQKSHFWTNFALLNLALSLNTSVYLLCVWLKKPKFSKQAYFCTWTTVSLTIFFENLPRENEEHNFTSKTLKKNCYVAKLENQAS